MFYKTNFSIVDHCSILSQTSNRRRCVTLRKIGWFIKKNLYTPEIGRKRH
jgi:hypothetical protein